MHFFVNMEDIFQILQLLTQKQEYSSLQHNFRPAKNISIMSCRCAKGKDESRSTAISPAPCTSYTDSNKLHLLQGRLNLLMPNSFQLKTHPLREKWKDLHHVSTIAEIASSWIHYETKATWPRTCSARSSEKYSLMPFSWESKQASGKCLAHHRCYNVEGCFSLLVTKGSLGFLQCD